MSITPPDYPGELPTGEPKPLDHPAELPTSEHKPPVRMPNSLVTAALLMWLGALLYFVAYAIAVVQIAQEKDDMDDWFAENSTFNDSDADQVFASVMATIVFVGIVSVLLWAWMAWINGRGRRWARTVATILGVINIAYLVRIMAYGGAPLTIALISWFTVIVGPLMIALLWNKDTSAYYQAVRFRNAVRPAPR